MGESYVCTLDEASLKKAREELNEIPSDRMAAIQALRDWVKQQPHITVPDLDDLEYLAFLRGSKFSQLRAREMVEGNMAMRSTCPDFFHSIDTKDPKLQILLNDGLIVPLPKRTKDGCQIVLYRTGKLDVNLKKYEKKDMIRTSLVVNAYLAQNESTQVNGTVFINDCTGFTAKHITTFGASSEMKKFKQLFIKNAPGRYKQFHYYNIGLLFETMLAIARPFTPKKFIDRINVHDNLETLYKEVPMEYLPDEYLPDDYTGPSAGSIKQLIENFKREIHSDKFRNRLLDRTQPQWGVDESKRPNKDASLQQSFRKLNVD